MPTEPLINPLTVDFSRVVADREAIRAYNPQRFEMEQLDAVVLLDAERKLIVGYKDVRADEFWTRGHFPGNPLLPGVLMCEAVAQLCGYYVMSQKVMPEGQMLGFGGMDGIRFRSKVRPGERLILVASAKKLKRVASLFDVQGFVGDTLALEGEVIGAALSRSEQ